MKALTCLATKVTAENASIDLMNNLKQLPLHAFHLGNGAKNY